MIKVNEVAFISYSDLDCQGSGSYHQGLYQLSSKALDFYEKIFGFPKEPPATPFASEYDHAYDLPAENLNLKDRWKPKGKARIPAGAFEVTDYQSALQTIKAEKVTIIEEKSSL